MKSYKPLKILISGGNQGIGYHMVHTFLKQGHHVYVLDIELDQLKILSKTCNQETLAYTICDMKDEDMVKESIAKAINTLGHIDYAIHNACMCTFESFMDTDIKTMKEVLDINYFGAIHMIKHILPHFNQRHQGHIYLTSSGVGIMGFKNISPYASSKGALESLAKCLNIELKDTNIKCHLIHPPLTHTKSASGLGMPKEMMADPKVVGERLAKRMHHKKRIITYTKRNRVMVALMYLMPVRLGRFMSMMTDRYQNNLKKPKKM